MNFLFTCGGTAGHVNPAIAVAGRLREIFPDCGILFLGAEGQMEMQLLPREGYEVRPLHITNISRGKSLSDVAQNISTVKNVLASMERTRHVIREFRPDAVIGTGGYVCYPVLMQAARMHIPTLVHESNAVPGVAVKALANKVDRIYINFEKTAEYLAHSDMTMAEMADRTGFAGASYMAEIFKRYYKMSPREYRRASTMPDAQK
jgi:UDP-N-acetylglucosamine--N-acetylmuramyl-(pentapeptide) pyrophosphoryl-undecaprenol N-acetylglucosamine transferase